MNPALLLGGLGTTVLCTAVLLVFERRELKLGIWLMKPLAAAGFVACALGFGALDSSYGKAILLGLCLSWLGDVLLLVRGQSSAFLLGMASFLLAHIAYAWAFFGLGPDLQASVYALLPMALGGLLCLRWLWPQLQGAFAVAVPVYVAAIGIMVVLSAGASVSTATLAFFAGALLFAVSDVFVARQRFVVQAYSNRQWGLPLYFLAQLILAASVAAPAVHG